MNCICGACGSYLAAAARHCKQTAQSVAVTHYGAGQCATFHPHSLSQQRTCLLAVNLHCRSIPTEFLRGTAGHTFRLSAHVFARRPAFFLFPRRMRLLSHSAPFRGLPSGPFLGRRTCERPRSHAELAASMPARKERRFSGEVIITLAGRTAPLSREEQQCADAAKAHRRRRRLQSVQLLLGSGESSFFIGPMQKRRM